MKKHYTRNEVAARWKCHRSTIDARLKNGDLKEVQLPSGKYKIHIDDIILVETLKPVRPKEREKRKKKAEIKIETANIWSKIKNWFVRK